MAKKYAKISCTEKNKKLFLQVKENYRREHEDMEDVYISDDVMLGIMCRFILK